MCPLADPPGLIVTLGSPARSGARRHEAQALEVLACRLAALKGWNYGGEYAVDRGHRSGQARLYFVPDETLLIDDARQLGIADEDDLFGGVVPHAFVATKTITHALVAADAAAPAGWSAGFSDAIRDIVLPGYAVFSAEDARRGASRLLSLEPGSRLRYKPARGIGGGGQVSLTTLDELETCLANDSELVRCGAVIEIEVEELLTWSMGQTHVSDLAIAYYGTQFQTRNHKGQRVYGGTDLTVIRGSLQSLLRDLPNGAPAELRLAVEQACRYDRAIGEAFPGFMASRRNYDVLQGISADGRKRSGVLEQSWRCGGATPAEIAALEAFRADSGLTLIHTESREIYEAVEPPLDATVYFRGDDPETGTLLKYGRIRRHGHPAAKT